MTITEFYVDGRRDVSARIEWVYARQFLEMMKLPRLGSFELEHDQIRPFDEAVLRMMDRLHPLDHDTKVSDNMAVWYQRLMEFMHDLRNVAFTADVIGARMGWRTE